jgi:hypothetical protein
VGAAPDGVRLKTSQESGGAAYYEHQFKDAYAVGGQLRAGFGDGSNRYSAGVVGKAWVPRARTLFLAEADFVRSQFATVNGTTDFVGYLGFTVFPVRGLWIGVYGERNQTDLGVTGSAVNAGNLQINWFPSAHFEMVALGRVQGADDATTRDLFKTLMVMLHYYL